MTSTAVAREVDGIGVVADDCTASDNLGRSSPAVWDELWRVHVMVHLHAAQALLPSMFERVAGYHVSTASGAARTAGARTGAIRAFTSSGRVP